MTPVVSVIIPACDEARALPATLAALRAQTIPHEVIVVSAASSDGTVEIAVRSGARVIELHRRQRAAQMNAGAAEAGAETILFLHADTHLHPTGLARMERALRSEAVVGGGFARRYDPGSPLLRATCALAEIRTRCFGWFLGDQAMFLRRTAFDRLGGFRPWDLFEDLDLARRLKRLGRLVTVRPPVVSDGRRFAAYGAARTTARDLWLTVRYLSAGRPPRPLAALPEIRPTPPAGVTPHIR